MPVLRPGRRAHLGDGRAAASACRWIPARFHFFDPATGLAIDPALAAAAGPSPRVQARPTTGRRSGVARPMSTGASTRRSSPPRGTLDHPAHPPASSARSTIVDMPRCPGSGAGRRSVPKPRPSSSTRPRCHPRLGDLDLQTEAAPACLRTLTTASCAIRYRSAAMSASGLDCELVQHSTPTSPLSSRCAPGTAGAPPPARHAPAPSDAARTTATGVVRSPRRTRSPAGSTGVHRLARIPAASAGACRRRSSPGSGRRGCRPRSAGAPPPVRVAAAARARGAAAACAAGLSRLHRSLSSASFRSVMSSMTPRQNRIEPSSASTGQASSRIHTVRPSFVEMRYSDRNGSPRSFDRRCRPRPDRDRRGAIRWSHSSGSSTHSSP